VEYRLGEYKGTARCDVGEVFNDKLVIWRIDPSMAARSRELLVEEYGPEMAQRIVKVYLGVTDLYELKSRKLGRDGRDPEKKKGFMENLRRDWDFWKKYGEGFYDHVVINREGEFEKCVEEVLGIIENRRMQE